MIVVVADWVSKHATFVPTLNECTAEDTTKFFFKHVVQYWGLLNPSLITVTVSLRGVFRLSCSSLWGWHCSSLQAFTHIQMGKQSEWTLCLSCTCGISWAPTNMIGQSYWMWLGGPIFLQLVGERGYFKEPFRGDHGAAVANTTHARHKLFREVSCSIQSGQVMAWASRYSTGALGQGDQANEEIDRQ